MRHMKLCLGVIAASIALVGCGKQEEPKKAEAPKAPPSI